MIIHIFFSRIVFRLLRTKNDVCGWVKRSWDAISNQIIFNSFKKCAISNMLDGSEDDMVYEEIDKLLAEIEKENLDELDDETEIVDN